MSKLTLVIKPLEPLMLRSSGEFDIETKGPASYAKSLLVPRPSTIAGMLASLLYKGSNKDYWLDDIKQNIKPISDICGPLIVKDNYGYVPLRIGSVFTFLKAPLKELSKCISDKISDIISFYEDKGEDYDKIDTKISKLMSQDWTDIIAIQPRLGIGLDRSRKVTKEGMLYVANYVSINASIYVIVNGDSKEIKSALDGKISTFGGEGRLVKLHILDDEAFSCDKFEDSKPGVLLSPLPVESATRFIGEFSIIGMGFDLKNNRRKEIVKAILEGSIVINSIPINEYYSIGYGSYVRIFTK
ncbi:type III-B CRISPR module-associated protein Cmr3 [Sulfurisphaera tokodaii]|uniref:CRISPR-associated protein Cmr3 n=2 Tax=Sulfurisphaera tokodaii TaxID=111955 RepID=F9VNQ4_SULTO|nr:type III-B CRISPR module-associated protein Cmr3 [Sulfurisphaera tokodaii]BAK54700.1 putative CRISPR-associated protein Cmr3 [Sulfurisphaera tokodaii str. 7]